MKSIHEEGDNCKDEQCTGTYEFSESQNCTCHISPPCDDCVDVPLVCNECGEESDG